MRRGGGIWVAGLVHVAVVGTLGTLLPAGSLGGAGGFWVHAILHAAAFGPLVWILRPALRGQIGGAPALAAVLLAGAATRAILVAGPPVLSGDLYRAVWEGQVVATGYDPWAHPPDHPDLAGLRGRLPEVREGITYWMLPAIQPPGAQLFAAAATSLAPGPETMGTALKAGLVVAEAALIGAFIALLRRRGQSPLLVAAWVWNPLAIVETAGSGHGDVLAITALALALLAAGSGRGAVAGALAGLSGAVKLAGFALVPFLLVRTRGWALRLGVLAAAAGAALLPLLPFLTPERTAGGLAARFGELGFSLAHYAEHWRFNESLFLLVEAVFGGLARPAALAAILAVAAVLLVRRTPVTLAMGLLAGAAFLLSPVAHPWYFLWSLSFLLLHPERRGFYAAALALSLTSVLSYFPLWTSPPGTLPDWSLPPALRAAEYLLPAAAGWFAARPTAGSAPDSSRRI